MFVFALHLYSNDQQNRVRKETLAAHICLIEVHRSQVLKYIDRMKTVYRLNILQINTHSESIKINIVMMEDRVLHCKSWHKVSVAGVLLNRREGVMIFTVTMLKICKEDFVKISY